MTPQLAAAIERQRQTIRKEWQALHAANANRKPGPARVCIASSWDVTPVGLMLDWRKAERRGSLLTLDEAKCSGPWIDARQEPPTLCPSEPV